MERWTTNTPASIACAGGRGLADVISPLRCPPLLYPPSSLLPPFFLPVFFIPYTSVVTPPFSRCAVFQASLAVRHFGIQPCRCLPAVLLLLRREFNHTVNITTLTTLNLGRFMSLMSLFSSSLFPVFYTNYYH